MSGDGLEHEGLERLFANQEFVTKYGIGKKDPDWQELTKYGIGKKDPDWQELRTALEASDLNRDHKDAFHRALRTYILYESQESEPFPVATIARAAKNVAWVSDTLQKLVKYPSLLENRAFLIGTLKSLIKSLDADNNPKMAILKIQKDEVRGI